VWAQDPVWQFGDEEIYIASAEIRTRDRLARRVVSKPPMTMRVPFTV
jgi:hypothetical protein